MTGSFAIATGVHARQGGVFDATLDAGWSIGGRPNGGYLLAVAGRAALIAADRAHPLVISGHFLRPPSGGPAQVRTETLKSGRTVSTVRATLVQHEVAVLDTLIACGDGVRDDPEWTAGPPPALPPPEECLGGQPKDQYIELLDHVDIRLDPATAPFRQAGPSGTAQMSGWVRLHDGTDAGTLGLPLIADALPPTVFGIGMRGWAPTVELTVLIRGVPEPGWLQCVASTKLVAGGWFDEEADVYDSTGRLVAQSRQLALVGRA